MLPALLSLALVSGAADTDKPVIAVLYFENNSGSAELDLMRKGLADLMVTDLVAWDGVTVVERERLEAVLGELKLQKTKAFDQAKAVQVGRFLGARYLLSGKMFVQADTLRLDATLIDAQKNVNVASARAEGPKDDVFGVEQKLVFEVTKAIDLKLKDPAARRRAKVPTFDALVDYSKALDLSDQGEAEEAQKAFAALVSKSPTFLMARERKEQAVKALEAYNQRKKDLMTASALRVAKAADEALAKAAQFDSLAEQAKVDFLAFRVAKARLLARTLKQHLSTRGSPRVVLNDRRPQALETMKAWIANWRALMAEHERYLKAHTTLINGSVIPPSGNVKLTPELLNDAKDANLGDLRLPGDWALDELARFVLAGWLNDGDSFSVAPPPSALLPAEGTSVWKALDDRVEQTLSAAANAAPTMKQRAEYAALHALDFKAEQLEAFERDDEQVTTLQRVLDTFPTANGNDRRESRIKDVLAGKGYERGRRQQWSDGLTTCQIDDLNGGRTTAVSNALKRRGLEGLDQLAADFKKACGTAKTGYAGYYIFQDLAFAATNAQDCERAKTFWLEYLERGGSVSDMIAHHKNTPWCNFGDLQRRVTWMRFIMDGGWTPEVDQFLVSIRSHDGKQLVINGHNKDSTIDLALYLVPDGAGWRCRDAQWRTSTGDQVQGTCSVTLTKVAADKGGHDEGTFTASFRYEADGLNRKTELTKGEFRVRRE
ncbi:MAG: CsgG/HfaB family protein [Myxococcaceae bacterium]|nr:CsgG/HfaB family protein [Myxococcaceae bacterium]